MPIKKSELYSSLWESCDELRGGMDASQYKDYVLVLLFVKYVSDKYAGQKDALLDVPVGGRFADMVALKGDKEIGDKINMIIGKLAEANNLKGVIDVADCNDADKLGKGKEMVDRLANLVSIFNNPALDFRGNRAEGDDILGDAYEYLMRHFATESGKSKGQFYTPAEVSLIMAKVVGIAKAKSQAQTVYDPTSGSGSLLLKAAHEAPYGVTIYGQEMDNATAALAKMNMILHDNPTTEICQDNTLSSPHWKERVGSLKLHDFVVANVPFSTKASSNGFNPSEHDFRRFTYGIPPTKNGDYAFLLHILASLKSTGKGAVILPHGVLFRGNVEADIRRKIVRRGYIKGIIGLPADLFYGTGIPASPKKLWRRCTTACKRSDVRIVLVLAYQRKGQDVGAKPLPCDHESGVIGSIQCCSPRSSSPNGLATTSFGNPFSWDYGRTKRQRTSFVNRRTEGFVHFHKLRLMIGLSIGVADFCAAGFFGSIAPIPAANASRSLARSCRLHRLGRFRFGNPPRQ